VSELDGRKVEKGSSSRIGGERYMFHFSYWPIIESYKNLSLIQRRHQS